MPNWGEVLLEIQRAQLAGVQAADIVRRAYLGKLHAHTSRNIIAYYSGWLSKPNIMQTDISDEDTNGFTMAVHQLDRSKGLDLILHTPGGGIAATQGRVS